MLYVLVPTIAVIVVVLLLIAGPFAGIGGLVGAIVILGLVLSRRTRNVKIERTNPAPTGTTRKGTGAADTANRRVGQV